jgi:hypothetical protein
MTSFSTCSTPRSRRCSTLSPNYASWLTESSRRSCRNPDSTQQSVSLPIAPRSQSRSTPSCPGVAPVVESTAYTVLAQCIDNVPGGASAALVSSTGSEHSGERSPQPARPFERRSRARRSGRRFPARSGGHREASRRCRPRGDRPGGRPRPVVGARRRAGAHEPAGIGSALRRRAGSILRSTRSIVRRPGPMRAGEVRNDPNK